MMGPTSPNLLPILIKAQLKAAKIALVDPRALPIFARLDHEVRILSATVKSTHAGDPLERARALLATATNASIGGTRHSEGFSYHY